MQSSARVSITPAKAWHASITRERGARWPEGRLNCLDDGFLHDLNRVGVGTTHVPNVGLAGWRREHAHVTLHHTDGGYRHAETFRAVLAGGYLEAAR